MGKLMVFLAGVCAVVPVTILSAAAPEAGTRPAGDAVGLYLRAAGRIRVASPSETEIAGFDADRPPYPEAWHRLAKAAREANGPVYELARRARLVDAAVWPADPGYAYRLPLHRVVNQLNDAASYEHARGRHAAALEFVRDALHVCDVLKGKPSRDLVRLITGSVYQATVLGRLLVVSVDSPVVSDAGADATQDLRVGVVRELIKELFDQREPEEQLTEIFGPPGPAWVDETWTPATAVKTLTRANTERTVAGMALACRLFHFDKGRWPESLDELVPDYVPRGPVVARADAGAAFRRALGIVRR